MSDNIMTNNGTDGLNDVRTMLAPLSQELTRYDRAVQAQPTNFSIIDFYHPLFDTLLERFPRKGRKYVRYGEEILILRNDDAVGPSTLPPHLSTLPVLFKENGAKEIRYMFGRYHRVSNRCNAAVNSVSANFGWKLSEGMSPPEVTENLIRSFISRLNDPVTTTRALVELVQVMRVTSDFSAEALATAILPLLNPALNRVKDLSLALHAFNYFLLGWTRVKRSMADIRNICTYFHVVTNLIAHRNEFVVKLALQGVRILLFMRVTNVDISQLVLFSCLREYLYPMLLRFYLVEGQPITSNEKVLGRMALELVKDLAICNQDDSLPSDNNDRRIIAELLFPDHLLVLRKRNCYMVPAETEEDQRLWRDHINSVWSDPLMRQLHKDLPYQKFRISWGLANYPLLRNSSSVEVKLERKKRVVSSHSSAKSLCFGAISLAYPKNTYQKASERYTSFHSDVLPHILKMPNTDLEMVISYVSLTYEKGCKEIREITSPLLVNSISKYLHSDNLLVQRLAAVALGNILITADKLSFFHREIEIEDPNEDVEEVKLQVDIRSQEVKEDIFHIIEPFLNLNTPKPLLFEIIQMAGYMCQSKDVPARICEKVFAKLENMVVRADKQCLTSILWALNRYTYFITTEKMALLMNFGRLLNTIYNLYLGRHRYARDLKVRRRAIHSMIHIIHSEDNEYRLEVVAEYPLVRIFWNEKYRQVEIFKQIHRMIPIEFYGETPAWVLQLWYAGIPPPVLQ